MPISRAPKRRIARRAGARVRSRPLLVLTEGGFLLDPSNGESFTVNASAHLILTGLLEKRDSRTLWRRLVRAFAIPPAQARRDVAEFLLRLSNLELVDSRAP
jgi:Coenzyme PQQ synthesis protein D (PqqD)